MKFSPTAILNGALDLVFAPSCVACAGPISTRASDRLVCSACWSKMRSIPAPRCERCWTPLPIGGADVEPSCRLCPELRPAIRSVRSAYLHDGPARPLVHALKYRGWHAVGRGMASRMARLSLSKESDSEISVVVPVPLTAVRRRQRGYNQAEELAHQLAGIRGWRCVHSGLVRRGGGGSQTTLHPSERRANVAGAFFAPAAAVAEIAAKHVLLVDDVWTTGATARACCDALLDAGARAVSVITFARALPELERHSRRVELAAIS